jgi:uncharacterized cofD-like protein
VRDESNVKQVEGESNITHFGGTIERVFLKPDRIRAYPETIRAILDADLIIMGPGSLYTSVLPNLLIDAMPEALRASRAIKMYVCNVATQHGETDGYAVHDHVRGLEKHIGAGIVNVVLANSRMNVHWADAPAGAGEIVQITTLNETPRIAAADCDRREACPGGMTPTLARAVMQIYRDQWGE